MLYEVITFRIVFLCMEERTGFVKGYVQVYTGNGKGKTTASLGLAIRAAGAGLGVFIIQFMKKGMYSEIKALKKLDNIVVEQYGTGHFVKGKPSDAERAACRQGYERLCRIIEAGKHDLVIAEEANIACFVITSYSIHYTKLYDIHNRRRSATSGHYKLNMFRFYINQM